MVLDDATRLDEALNALRVFAIGASWGGTRSLMAPMTITRDNPHPRNDETILRLQIGLEDPADLSADLAAFFDILTNKKGA